MYTYNNTIYDILILVAGEFELCVESPEVPKEGGEQAVGVGKVRCTHHLADTMHTQLLTYTLTHASCIYME